MAWLFGQIWLWLLIAFVLGVAFTALVLRLGRRSRAVSGARTGAARREPAAGGPAREGTPGPAPRPGRGQQPTASPPPRPTPRPRPTPYTPAGGPSGTERESAPPEHRQQDRQPSFDQPTKRFRLVPAHRSPGPRGGTTGGGAGSAPTGATGGVRGGAEAGRADTSPARGETDAPDEGRREGVLPLGPADWHTRNEWPDEQDVVRDEEQRRRER